MILRRIAAALKRQDWATVFIEFVLVILGVLIALQVNNWNEARADNARMSRYIDELHVDLDAEIFEMSRIRDNALRRYAATQFLLDHATGWKPPETIPLFGGDFVMEKAPAVEIKVGPALFNEALSMESFDGQRHTYDALTSTGDFQLFENLDIAKDLRAYYADLRTFQDFEQSHLIPQHLALLTLFHRHGLSHPDIYEVEKVTAALKDDDELASRFRAYSILAFNHYRRLPPLIKRAEELGSELETAK